MPTIIRARNLTKVYDLGDGKIDAVGKASLEIQSGDMVAIVGKVDSGKSSLLHMLGCMQRPDSGQLELENRDLTKLDDEELAKIRAQRVGFMFQAFNLLPSDTALSNVEVPLRHQGVPPNQRREKANEALQIMGLEKCVEFRPGQLSPTQRQCVSIARAMVHEPAVILADEPTKVLDSSGLDDVMGRFQKLNDAGMTIVVTTDDPNVASYCKTQLQLSGGKLKGGRKVSRRRVVPREDIGGQPPPNYDEVVCPRCNEGNPKDSFKCKNCRFLLHLTKEEEQSIKGRLSGAEKGQVGVESTSDDAKIPVHPLALELQTVPFLADLGTKSLTKIVPALQGFQYTRGQRIVSQGDEGDSFYIVRSGTVQVIREQKDKPPLLVAQLGAKEGFGEISLLTGQPRTATVAAATDVVVMRLPKDRFQSLLAENLSLSLYFKRLMNERLVHLKEKLKT